MTNSETDIDRLLSSAFDGHSEQLKADKREIISSAVGSIIVSSLTLFKVTRHARRGNYQAATMWAVLFAAFSSNYNSAAAERRERMGINRYRNVMRSLTGKP